MGRLSGTWTALVPWPGDRGHTRAEVSGENVVLAQLVGLAALKDNSSKADPPGTGLCLRLEVLPGPCARDPLRPRLLLQRCHSRPATSLLAALRKRWRAKQ